MTQHKAINILTVTVTVILFGVYYAYFSINFESGKDLKTRISEARYFFSGINPYDVYVGRIGPIEEFGHPNAYSFISYVLAYPFHFIRTEIGQTLVFSTIDVICILIAIIILSKLVQNDGKSNFPKPDVQQTTILAAAAMACLLPSVFFYQHVVTLNYNVIVLTALLVGILGIKKEKTVTALVGLVIVGLKPSVAVPFFIWLAVTQRFWILALGTAIYALILSMLSYQLNEYPWTLLAQLATTQRMFSDGYSDGLLFFLSLVNFDEINLLSAFIVLIAFIIFRSYVFEPTSGLIFIITASICFFYNNPHAWILATPLLYLSFNNVWRGKSKLAMVILLCFILVPRLASFFPGSVEHYYVAVHNVIRFGLLIVASVLIFRDANQTKSAV